MDTEYAKQAGNMGYGDRPVADSDAAAREVDGRPDRDRATVLQEIADCRAGLLSIVVRSRALLGQLELLTAELESMP